MLEKGDTVKRFLSIILLVLCVFSITACASAEERFYNDKGKVMKSEKAPEFNVAFREALEDSDEFNQEVKDSYFIVGYYQGRCICDLYVLTEDGEYLTIKVEDAERIYHIVDPILPKHELINEPPGDYYYHDGVLYK